MMEQYLQALREREDISEEVLLELEERFKEVEEVIDVTPTPTFEERVQAVETKTVMTALAIKLIAPTFPDEVLSQVPLLFDEWAVGVDYVADKSVVRFEDDLYRVITSHRSQADWTPDVALTVFSRVSRPGEIPAWKQGSYTKGMKVTHNGFTWESVVDSNVWEPGVVHETIWKKIT